MTEISKRTVLDLNEIDSDVIIGRYDLIVNGEGNISVSLPATDKLPDIIICKTIGNTRYSVFGEYAGNNHLEDKVSQIIKRDMEG